MKLQRNSIKKSKAFSLVELTVVLVLSSLIMISITRWITGVGNVVTSTISSGARYDEEVTYSNMDNEITSALPCDPNGYRTPFLSYDADSKTLAFTSSTTQNGEINLIRYRISNDGFQRSEVSPNGTCNYPQPTDWVTVVKDIDVSKSKIGYLNSNSQDINYLYVTCQYKGDANCDISAIYISLQNNKLSDPNSRVFFLQR